MMRFLTLVFFSFILLQQSVFANPYWDPQKVPKNTDYSSAYAQLPNVDHLKTVNNDSGIDVLRVQIDWNTDESYQVSKTVIEASGTEALLVRSKKKPSLGSYVGVLKNKQTGEADYYDSIGTGKEYRKLTRAINLRFPVPQEDMTFELYAENPQSGVMEKVVSQDISPTTLSRQPKTFSDVVVKELALASKTPSVRVNIYAEGYAPANEKSFWQSAAQAVKALQNEKFPGVEYMSFYGVYHPSNKILPVIPEDLGMPIPEYDSFLGLYFPYWDNFGRWYNVVYPTRDDKLRQALASAPYDYVIVLANDEHYWGVGNYKSFTAVPANSSEFIFLLMHEFGHFFGLNEEYEGGGRTELEFAADMPEPWSQNITFFTEPDYAHLKWKSFVDSSIELPTPDSVWKSSPPIYGAYTGGYGDSVSSKGRSHKPGLNCVMDTYEHFCDICTQAILQVVLQNS